MTRYLGGKGYRVITAEDGEKGMALAREQHPSVIELLLTAGADVQATDRWGNTPLWRAVFTAHGDIAASAALLAAGADLDTVNSTGVSPRALAERMGLTGLVPPQPAI